MARRWCDWVPCGVTWYDDTVARSQIDHQSTPPTSSVGGGGGDLGATVLCCLAPLPQEVIDATVSRSPGVVVCLLGDHSSPPPHCLCHGTSATRSREELLAPGMADDGRSLTTRSNSSVHHQPTLSTDCVPFSLEMAGQGCAWRSIRFYHVPVGRGRLGRVTSLLRHGGT